MSRRQKHELIRIVCCLAAFLVLLITDKALDGGLAGAVGGKYGWLLPFALYLAVYVAIGYDVLWRALRGVLHGQMLDENFLMCIATLGAFALAIYTGASGQAPEGFDEGCAVLIFYQVGEFFQDYATGRSRRSISELMDIRPDSAHVIRGGETLTVDPSEVQPGEVISVAPGEKIPLDGVIVKGATSLDTRALTGESLPREAAEGDAVVSGSVNMTSSVEIRVEKAFHDSTVAKILDLVENAAEQKSKAENFITKFARWYTPIVVAAALLLAVIPGAVTGDWEWVYRALSFLVVSCPCALVISVPLSFFAGIGAASKLGILVKGSNYLEKFDKANIFVFDKTGTLTKGNFAVVKVSPESERERILALAAAAERGSTHPIARSVVEAYGGEAEGGYTLTDHAGEGVEAKKEGSIILVGNEKLMRRAGIDFIPENGAGTALYVAHNGVFAGSLLVADEVKTETAAVIGDLNAMGCRTIMLTGDNERIAANVAEKVGVTDFKASLLPQDKVEEVERELNAKKPKDVLCFVGDGINDAPVLMRSDIGIAMGGVGSDAAIEASDIVLMRDDLTGIPVAKRVARKTMCVVYENILFSIIVKVAILILSAVGIAGMWLAVFGDVGVAVIAILNAMRVGSRRSVNAMKTGKTRILTH